MFSRSDYLATGDKDLLNIHSFLSASIVSPIEFEKIITEMNK
jgi:predicted nucleic acid-binding protein